MIQTRLLGAPRIFCAAAVVCGCMLAVSGAANAAATSLIPPISGHTIYGYGATTAAVGPSSGTPFKTAITFTNKVPGKNPWDSGAAMSFVAGAGAGDTIVASFYLRALKPASTKIEISVEEPVAPYASIGRLTFTATKKWQKLALTIKTPAAFAPGAEHVVFHTAYGIETVQLGGMTIIDKDK